MNREISKDEALHSALKSAQMEGFRITPKIESDCRRIVNGEISVAEYIRQIKETRLSERRAE